MHKDKNEILSDYYINHYSNLYFTGILGRGTSSYHQRIESLFENKSPNRVLEVGAGEGEHLRFVDSKIALDLVDYTMIDLRKLDITKHPKLTENIGASGLPADKIVYHQASVESLPFGKNSFDRIISTCLFHHIDDPMLGFSELKRVLKVGGEAVIGMPTDPGIVNRILKRLITIPKAKKSGVANPRLLFALEHRNHIHGLLQIARHVFVEDQLEMHFSPFRFASWNMNIAVYLRLIKKSN